MRAGSVEVHVWPDVDAGEAPLVLRLPEAEYVRGLHIDVAAGRLLVLGSRGRLRHYAVAPDRAGLVAALARRIDDCLPAALWQAELGLDAATVRRWQLDTCMRSRRDLRP